MKFVKMAMTSLNLMTRQNYWVHHWEESNAPYVGLTRVTLTGHETVWTRVFNINSIWTVPWAGTDPRWLLGFEDTIHILMIKPKNKSWNRQQIVAYNHVTKGHINEFLGLPPSAISLKNPKQKKRAEIDAMLWSTWNIGPFLTHCYNSIEWRFSLQH